MKSYLLVVSDGGKLLYAAQQQYIIRRKLNIIKLAEQLGNISEACRKLGVSRQHYYDIKKALEEGGRRYRGSFGESPQQATDSQPCSPRDRTEGSGILSSLSYAWTGQGIQ